MPAYGSCNSTCWARLELEMVRRCALGTAGAGNLGLSEHVKRFAAKAWPGFYWHRWSDMIRTEVCKGGSLAIFGPASSHKTGTCAALVLTFYWALSDQFTGLCSTTDLERLDLRIWGDIKKRFRSAKERYPWLPGNMIDSMRRICTDDKGTTEGRDFRNGILGIACKRGGEWQGLGDYSGIKNKFVMLVADECQLMESGFLQGAANLKSNDNSGRFTGIYLGNLVDLETPLGEAAEPECGWDALPDSDVSRVYPTKFFEGRAIQLVGRDSPNFDYPDGAEPFQHLIGRRFLAMLKHDYGEGSPLYVSQAGGTIPRSSMANRVITKEVVKKFNAFDSVTWGSTQLTKLYAMDVSYTVSHGDRTIGLPMAFGRDIEGQMRLACLERAKVYSVPQLLPGQTVEDALAIQAKGECDRLGIPYSHFFFDGTGRSSFTAAAMRAIGTMVQPIEFGGKATERPNFVGKKFQEGPNKGELMPCFMVFGKFVSELWFAWRYVIEADQLRDLPEDVARDGYARLWKMVAGNKIDVEPKQDMKERISRSPDHGDALVSGIEGARRLGFVIGNQTGRNSRGASWLSGLKRDMESALKDKDLTYA